MKRWLVLTVAAVSLLPIAPLEAQTRIADSLQTLLKAEPQPDTVRIGRLQTLANELLAKDLPQAITLLEEALVLSKHLSYTKGEGKALISLGTAARLQADYNQARRYTKRAHALFLRRNDHRGLAMTYLQVSLIDLMQENPAAALRSALKGLPYAEQAGDRITQTQLQYVIGSIHVQLGDYPEALRVLKTTLRNGEQVGDEYVVAATLDLLGNTYQMLQDWSKARACFQRSMLLNRKLGDIRSATGNEIKIAELYTQQGEYNQAVAWGLRARALAQANQDPYNLPAAKLALARAYLSLHHLDSAILLARQGFHLSQRTRSNEFLRNASNILAEAYAQQGDFVQAYRYHTLWTTYKDSLSGEETQRKTSALRYGYELDQKQAKIALLTKTHQLQEQTASRQRQQLYGLLAGLGGLVILAALLGRNIFLKQQTNQRLNEKNQQIAAHRDQLDHTLEELKATQQQLVQSEKLVALAALTAGVAHEIQNPLNFVNNFSEVSLELVTELEEEQHQPARDLALEAELLGDLKQNLVKIHQHGSRADRIIKGMLEHARGGGGQRQSIDLNAMATEYLRLAYHDVQAKHRGFIVTRTLDLDPNLGEIKAVPQEIGRVLLNLYTNAFYALWQQATKQGASYVPELRVSTCRRESQVEVRVRDNGPGIPAVVVGKIFEPFYTTKPPGEGTGLGLSLSYDIIAQGYGGTITVSSQEEEYTEFTVLLPNKSNEQSKT